jgi:hypothetical protein
VAVGVGEAVFVGWGVGEVMTVTNTVTSTVAGGCGLGGGAEVATGVSSPGRQPVARVNNRTRMRMSAAFFIKTSATSMFADWHYRNPFVETFQLIAT